MPLKPQLRCHQILSVSKKCGPSKILMPSRIFFGQRGTMSISHSNRILYMKSLAMLKMQKLKIFLNVLRINVQMQMTYLPVSLSIASMNSMTLMAYARIVSLQTQQEAICSRHAPLLQLAHSSMKATMVLYLLRNSQSKTSCSWNSTVTSSKLVYSTVKSLELRLHALISMVTTLELSMMVTSDHGMVRTYLKPNFSLDL